MTLERRGRQSFLFFPGSNSQDLECGGELGEFSLRQTNTMNVQLFVYNNYNQVLSSSTYLFHNLHPNLLSPPSGICNRCTTWGVRYGFWLTMVLHGHEATMTLASGTGSKRLCQAAYQQSTYP